MQWIVIQSVVYCLALNERGAGVGWGFKREGVGGGGGGLINSCSKKGKGAY